MKRVLIDVSISLMISVIMVFLGKILMNHFPEAYEGLASFYGLKDFYVYEWGKALIVSLFYVVFLPTVVVITIVIFFTGNDWAIFGMILCGAPAIILGMIVWPIVALCLVLVLSGYISALLSILMSWARRNI